MKKWWIVFSMFLLSTTLQAQKGFEFREQKAKKQLDVFYDGKLMTAYCYHDSIRKPFLFPLNTLEGVTVTRGYPLQPKLGERTDHPHHTGMWMNYESVNGLDFWNNSTAIASEKRNLYGTITHDKIVSHSANGNTARLTVTARWLRPDGVQLIQETTTYLFTIKNGMFFIDRTSHLKALDQPVVFKDVKDGFFAIRVARELEMPSKEPGVFVDANGNETKVPVDNNGVTGMYYSSEGIKGDSVWGTKGRWAMLKGLKDNRAITIGLFDHPSNVGYPTYWHARGYGLFALNPLGRKVFSNGKEDLNFTLQPNSSVTFRYRVLLAADKPVNEVVMNKEADEFALSK